MSKKYYIIYKELGHLIGELFCIVESKAVAEDFCSLNEGFYYIERTIGKRKGEK